jgi:hypothetical protein
MTENKETPTPRRGRRAARAVEKPAALAATPTTADGQAKEAHAKVKYTGKSASGAIAGADKPVRPRARRGVVEAPVETPSAPPAPATDDDAAAVKAEAAPAAEDLNADGFKASKSRREAQEAAGIVPDDMKSSSSTDRSRLSKAWAEDSPKPKTGLSVPSVEKARESAEKKSADAVNPASASAAVVDSAPTDTTNLAMVTPVEFEKTDAGARGPMKPPATSSVAVVRPLPADEPALVAPTEEQQASTGSHAAASADAVDAESDSADSQPDASVPAPVSAPHDPIPATNSNGLDPLDPRAAGSSRRKRFALEATLLAGGVATLAAAVIIFINR